MAAEPEEADDLVLMDYRHVSLLANYQESLV